MSNTRHSYHQFWTIFSFISIYDVYCIYNLTVECILSFHYQTSITWSPFLFTRINSLSSVFRLWRLWISSCAPSVCSRFLTSQLSCSFTCLFIESLSHQLSFPGNTIHSISLTPLSLMPPPNLSVFLHYFCSLVTNHPNIFNCSVDCNVLRRCQFLHIFLKTHNSIPKFPTSCIFRNVSSPEHLEIKKKKRISPNDEFSPASKKKIIYLYDQRLWIQLQFLVLYYKITFLFK